MRERTRRADSLGHELIWDARDRLKMERGCFHLMATALSWCRSIASELARGARSSCGRQVRSRFSHSTKTYAPFFAYHHLGRA